MQLIHRCLALLLALVVVFPGLICQGLQCHAQVEITNSIGMQLVKVPPGKFQFGDPSEQAREVDIASEFYIGKYELTIEQFLLCMETFPDDTTCSFQKGVKPIPVEDKVNYPAQFYWNVAPEICKRLSNLPEEKAKGRIYRPPTEEEWEYACRAGSNAAFCFGDDETMLSAYAWFRTGTGLAPSGKVGQKKPNAWGLYDVHGGMNEFCSISQVTGPPPTDQLAISDDLKEAMKIYATRGGSHSDKAKDCRCWSRNGAYGFVQSGGLRVVMIEQGSGKPDDIQNNQKESNIANWRMETLLKIKKREQDEQKRAARGRVLFRGGSEQGGARGPRAYRREEPNGTFSYSYQKDKDMDIQLYKCELEILNHLIRMQKENPASGDLHQPREWKDASGNFRTQATFIRTEESIVYLKKVDGSELKVPVEKLSKEDREYLKSLGDE